MNPSSLSPSPRSAPRPGAPRPATPRHPPQDAPGPAYVNAEPRPPASAKALGLTCAFFGMLAAIGALAALSSGKLNLHIPLQALRATLSLAAGLALFLLGTALLHKPPSPAHLTPSPIPPPQTKDLS